jgi:hypothetical protein
MARDLTLAISGSAVVVCFLYAVGWPLNQDFPVAAYFAIAAIGYVIGYVLQDVFCLLGFVTTRYLRQDYQLVQWMYKRYTGTPWRQVQPDFDFAARERSLHDEAEISQFERIVMLMQFGTAGAPSSLVCAALLLWKWTYRPATGDAVLFWSALALAVCLWGLSWLKAGQMTQLLVTDLPRPAAK